MPRNLQSSSQYKSSDLIAAVKNILLQGTIGTQEDIKNALQAQGIEINQSKISRLLRKIGAVKTTNERKQIVYSMPREPAPPSTRSPLAQLVIDVVANESLVVIRTNPGSASLIGRLLDYHNQELAILGTVAGDDTILVVPRSTKQMNKTLIAVKKLLSSIG